MFEEVLKSAAAPVVVVALFLWYMERSEKQRAENAKAAEMERREYQKELNSTWANAIKNIMDKVTESNEKVVDALQQHETASQDRYERTGNTQDILDKLNALAGTLNKGGTSQ